MTDVIIIGAGGHARVIADIVLGQGDRLLGFLDDNPDAKGFCGIPVLGKIDDYPLWPNARFVVGIGNAQARQKIVSRLRGVTFHTPIHPSAVISPLGTAIGPGTVIMANAVVNPGTTVGCHCILNTGSILEHDNTIGDYVHISVAAKTAGTVTVGGHTWVGIGATISNNLTVCSHCMIGAGAVVVRDISIPGTYVGVPARRLQ